MTTRAQAVVHHYESVWQAVQSLDRLQGGRIHELPDDFCVATIAPFGQRHAWTYATVGMSQFGDRLPIELHLLSPEPTDDHIELLTVVAHYHRTGARLGLGHTVNFGRPWMPHSRCDHGLISLPYLDGPRVENLQIGSASVRCLWLVPITRDEREFVRTTGVDALEERFEMTAFNYLDPRRPSVV